MKCPQCQFDNREQVRFCEECGSKLELTCLSCGAAIPPDRKFCGSCGSPLASPIEESKSPETYTPKHLAEKILTSKSALEGERKQVTVLFADLKGSMELLADRDPEESRTLLNAVVERMMEAVHRYEGTVNNVMGDGIMATFGAPLAHEDHALRACYAALQMQEAVSRYSAEVQLSQGVPVTIRVGLNSGEVIVGSVGDDLRMDYTSVGQTTHLAARMEQMATPGSIMVSENTHKLTEGFFRFKALGEVRVKGLSDPVHVYELEGVGPLRTRLEVSARRGLVKFVGRQRELEQMRRVLDLAKEGHGQIAAVVGEPGVGKSRLCYEFKIIEQAECKVLETFSVSHGKAYPYLPITEFLKGYFQIALEDDERTRREKVLGKVLHLDRNLEETLEYLFFLLGIAAPTSPLRQMDPKTVRNRTLEGIRRLILRESLNQPLIVIFEDLHWIDSETQAFLDILSESIASARVFLLVNYRPEYRHEWGSKTYYTQLRLDPLGQEDAQDLLTALLGDALALEPFKKLVVERTQGNPFFMEEVVQNLVEEKGLAGEMGNYWLAKSPAELEIPPTVQVALAARIDRLGLEEKGLLQTLAIMGRKFSLGLLKTVVEQPEDELHRLLLHLQGGEFIYEQPAFPEVEYVFKHALTQEVTYNSVLTERRRVLHERTAQGLEDLYRDRLEEHYSDIAHHYARGGDTRKALDYLKIAGQQAVQRSANAEAVNHLTAALELLKTLPDTPERDQRELTLRAALGGPLIATKGHTAPEVRETYDRALALCQKMRGRPDVFPVMFGVWRFHAAGWSLHAAREVANELMSQAQSVQDSGLLLEAHRALGLTGVPLGELESARTHLKEVFALYNPQQHGSHKFQYGIDPKVHCLIFDAHALWLLGYPDQATERIQEAVNFARDLPHPYSLVLALGHHAVFHQYGRMIQATQKSADELRALSDEFGVPHFLVYSTILRGWVLAEQGRVDEGVEVMQEAVGTGIPMLRPYFLAVLAGVYGRIQKTEAGLNCVAKAFDVVQTRGEVWHEADLHRIKGELLFYSKASEISAAETSFCRAIDIARHQGARSLELRAVMSLSLLLHQEGKTEEARQMLAEIYGWFTEGFDTADLKEAKALLDELS